MWEGFIGENIGGGKWARSQMKLGELANHGAGETAKEGMKVGQETSYTLKQF